MPQGSAAPLGSVLQSSSSARSGEGSCRTRRTEGSKLDEAGENDSMQQDGQTDCVTGSDTQSETACNCGESRNDSDNDCAVTSRGEKGLHQALEGKGKGDSAPLQKKAGVTSSQATRGKRNDRSEAEKALRYLLEGVHILTRQMKNARSTFRTSSTIVASPPVSEGVPLDVVGLTGLDSGAIASDQDGCHVPHRDRDVSHNSARIAEYESRDRSWSGCSGLSVGSTSHSSVGSVRSYTSEDDRRLADITSRHLPGPLGADLMSLSHACRMVGENALNASSEAETAVDDVRSAIDETSRARKRAKAAERAAQRLYQENVMLRAELDRVRAERKVLVKAVRNLREERSEIQRRYEERRDRGIIRHVEDHVATAISAHERRLFCARSSVNLENRKRAASTGMLTLPGGRKTEKEKTEVEALSKSQKNSMEGSVGLDLEDALAEPATGAGSRNKDERMEKQNDGKVSAGLVREDASVGREAATVLESCNQEKAPEEKGSETSGEGSMGQDKAKKVQPMEEKKADLKSHQATVLLTAKPKSTPFLAGMFGASASTWMKNGSNKTASKKVVAAKSQISPAPTGKDANSETQDKTQTKEKPMEMMAAIANEVGKIPKSDANIRHRGEQQDETGSDHFANETEETDEQATDKKKMEGCNPLSLGRTILDPVDTLDQSPGPRSRAVSADNVGFDRIPPPPYRVHSGQPQQSGAERVGRFFSNFNLAGMVGTMNSDGKSSEKVKMTGTTADTPQPSSLLRIVDTDSEGSNDESSMCSDTGSGDGGLVSPLSSAGPSPSALNDPGDSQLEPPSPSSYSLPSFASSSVEGSDNVQVDDDLGASGLSRATSDAQQYIRSLALPKSLSSRSYRLRGTGSWST